MKRYGYLFEQACEFTSLYRAFKKAFRGSGKTKAACRFCFHLEAELLRLREELEDETYRPAPYRYFKVFDPKERTISVAAFRDRVVHHAIVAALEPLFEPMFIYDSYATRKDKGTHKAVQRAQDFLVKNFFYLKLDIEKYFDNIDHKILLRLVASKVKDKKLLRLIGRIVENSDVSRGLEDGKGLPIGNLTSQFFANVYLNALDHFIKDTLRVKHYIRYMDDIVVFSDSRASLKGMRELIAKFLSDKLGLRLKDKATLLNTSLHGLPFLGYRVFPGIIRIRRENLARIRKRLEDKLQQFRKGIISEDKMVMSVRSWFAFMGFANSQGLRQVSFALWADIG